MQQNLKTAAMGKPLSGEKAELPRALGMAYTELLYAAAELRSAASRDDVDSRALLYNLADSLESAAGRLQDFRDESERQPAVQDSGD